jgi:hypothetical protein
MFLRVKHSLLALTTGLVMVAVALFALSCAPTPPKLRFVDDSGEPLLTETVRVLCYGTASAETLLADQILETDNRGEPSTSLPPGCNYIAALHLRHTQDSGKPGHGPAYWVYATSWQPGATTPLSATGDITLSDKWPLVLFNVVASLAWEPSLDGDPVVEDLENGLFHASAYLYDITDGHMAFGPVTIHPGGGNWNDADLRFLAANDYRPSVYVGGIVAGRIQYTSPVTAVFFSPGEVYLGRDWSRLGASDESSGRWYLEDAYRTILHEWAHYALFLYDEYQDINADGPSQAYCTCSGLSGRGDACPPPPPPDQAASPMAWHYDTTELWHPEAPQTPPGICEKTEQYQIHGQSDWETLGVWYQIQGLSEVPGLPSLVPPSTFAELDKGPALGLVTGLFGRRPGGAPPARPAPGRAIDITLDESLGKEETPLSQVYLIKTPAGAQPRILHQGKAAGSSALGLGRLGTIHVLGAEPLDELGVFVDRQATEEVPNGGRYTLRGELSAASITAGKDAWHASLDITPILDGSRLAELQVELTSLNRPDLPTPVVQLCIPDAGTGCSLEETMDRVTETTWIATLGGSAGLPRYGVLRVRAEGVGELIRWFQDGGGVPPAHDDGGSPVADGRLKVHTNQAVPNSRLCNRVLFMPAASYQALTRSLGMVQEVQGGPMVTVKGVLEVPLDIDIVLPRDGDCPGLGAGDHSLPVPVTLTLFYDQSSVDRPIVEQQEQQVFRINENNLQILHYSRAGDQWSQVPVAGRDPDLNWIATMPVAEDGIYAIAWISGTTVTTP